MCDKRTDELCSICRAKPGRNHVFCKQEYPRKITKWITSSDCIFPYTYGHKYWPQQCQTHQKKLPVYVQTSELIVFSSSSLIWNYRSCQYGFSVSSKHFPICIISSLKLGVPQKFCQDLCHILKVKVALYKVHRTKGYESASVTWQASGKNTPNIL